MATERAGEEGGSVAGVEVEGRVDKSGESNVGGAAFYLA